MSFDDVIINRRSVRAYLDKEIPRDVIEQILHCGRLAPSAGNVQPWVFWVTQDAGTRERLVNATFIGADETAKPHVWLLQAPVLVTVCLDEGRAAAKYKERGAKIYQYQDSGAAIQNILLSAAEKGLGTCWIGSFRPAQVAEILSIPSHLEPVSMISIGYPDPERPPKLRSLLEEDQVVFWDKH